jgi:hypothetical protein
MHERLEDLLTYQEAATEIGISPGAVKQAINRGAFHPIKIPRERHKFLRREEVIRYRDGKQAFIASQATGPSTAPSNPSEPARAAVANAEPPQELPEMLELLMMVAGIAWTANAASIRDTVIGVAHAYYAASPGLASPSPQLTKQPAKQNQESPLGTSAPASSGKTLTPLVRQIYETLAQSVAHTAADEQAINQLQALFSKYTQKSTPFSESPVPKPAQRA